MRLCIKCGQQLFKGFDPIQFITYWLCGNRDCSEYDKKTNEYK